MPVGTRAGRDGPLPDESLDSGMLEAEPSLALDFYKTGASHAARNWRRDVADARNALEAVLAAHKHDAQATDGMELSLGSDYEPTSESEDGEDESHPPPPRPPVSWAQRVRAIADARAEAPAREPQAAGLAADAGNGDGFNDLEYRAAVAESKLLAAKSALRKYRGKQLATMVQKPEQFSGSITGKSVQRIRDWLDVMSHYLSLLMVPSSDAVGVAVAFLRGAALRHWLHVAPLLKHEQPPRDASSWETFKQVMLARFDHVDPEHHARVRLDSLKQGKHSLAWFVRKFDEYIGYLPDMGEKDKVHRFLGGLNPNLARLCWINPTTGRQWDAYSPLAAHAVAIATAAGMRELLEDSGGSSSDDGARRAPERRWQRVQHRRNVRSVLRDGQRRPGGGPPNGRGGGPDRARGARGAPTTHAYTNAGGARFTRTTRVKNFCFTNRLCLCCYRPGGRDHQASTCTAAPAPGDPPGLPAVDRAPPEAAQRDARR